MIEPATVEQRSMPVPEGLEGLRVDAALARLFGLSRTQAAEIAASGAVLLDGRVAGKSDRVHAGGWLEVALPTRRAWSPPAEAVPADAVRVIYDDEDVL